MVQMWKGKESVMVHPSQVDKMIRRGWVFEKPAAKKATTKKG